MPLFDWKADELAMTIDLFSLADIGAILVGMIVVGALIFGVSMISEDPSGFSGFLRPKNTKTDEVRRKRR